MFNSPLKFSLFSTSPTSTIYRFGVASETFELSFEEQHKSIDPTDFAITDIIADVTFGLVVDYPEQKMQDIEYGFTNKHTPLPIISTINDILYEYIEEYQPVQIHFNCVLNEEKLRDFLNVILPRFTSKLLNYKLISKIGCDEHTFTIKRNDKAHLYNY